MENKIFSIKYPKGIAAQTFWIFGILALILGIIGIIYPEALLYQLGFTVHERALRPNYDYTLVFITASSMASLNMGIYYIFAASTHTRKFFYWTVPFRMLTFIVFSILILRGWAPIKFFSVAAWELIGSLATGGALWYEKRKYKAKN